MPLSTDTDYVNQIDDESYLLLLSDNATTVSRPNYPLARACLEKAQSLTDDTTMVDTIAKRLVRVNDLGERLIALHQLVREAGLEKSASRAQIHQKIQEVRLALTLSALSSFPPELIKKIKKNAGEMAREKKEIIPLTNCIFAFVNDLLIQAKEDVLDNTDDDEILEKVEGLDLLPNIYHFEMGSVVISEQAQRVFSTNNPLAFEKRMQKNAQVVWQRFLRRNPQGVEEMCDFLAEITHDIYNFLANEWGGGDVKKGALLMAILQHDSDVPYEDLEEPSQDDLARMDQAAARLANQIRLGDILAEKMSGSGMKPPEISDRDGLDDAMRRAKEWRTFLHGSQDSIRKHRYALAMAPLDPAISRVVMEAIEENFNSFAENFDRESEKFYNLAEPVLAYTYSLLAGLERKPQHEDPRLFFVDDAEFCGYAEEGFTPGVKRPKNPRAANDRIQRRAEKLCVKYAQFFENNKQIFEKLDKKLREIYCEIAPLTDEEANAILNTPYPLLDPKLYARGKK